MLIFVAGKASARAAICLWRLPAVSSTPLAEQCNHGAEVDFPNEQKTNGCTAGQPIRRLLPTLYVLVVSCGRQLPLLRHHIWNACALTPPPLPLCSDGVILFSS